MSLSEIKQSAPQIVTSETIVDEVPCQTVTLDSSDFGHYQVGYDPELGTHWLRPGNAGAWGDWVEMVAPPPPPEADEAAAGEYETSDMTARHRGPGRPRKSES